MRAFAVAIVMFALLAAPGFAADAPAEPVVSKKVEKAPPKAAAPEEKTAVPVPVDLGPAEGFRNGLAYEEAVEQLGSEGKLTAESVLEKATYRWTDDRGSSFICRFEDELLVYKTAFRTGKRVATGDKPLLNQKDYDALGSGASLEQALKIKPAGNRVSSSAVEVMEYRWTSPEGKTFDGRFEDGKLRQLTGRETAARARAKLAEQKKEEAKQAAAREGAAVTKKPDPAAKDPAKALAAELAAPEEAPEAPAMAAEEPALVEDEVPLEVEVPAEEEVSAEEEVPAEEAPYEADVVETPPVEPDNAEAQGLEEPEAEIRPRVHITGSSREEESSGRQRRARLPEYRHSLRRGSYQVVVRNPTNVQVSLGLRAGSEGRDATVGPNGRAAFSVDSGTYDLYFIYRDDPYTLCQGPAINLDGFRLPDAEVTLDGTGGYTIGVLEGQSTRYR